MPSLIPGYEYDIFISYRHKDNKGDHWVTEFVKALQAELDATFKEDISIYFDENPHDGLLETHDVGDSLKDKLKCLIFIPIISQTYCDPKSFAWNHEFLAFKKLAAEDGFGLKVKLANGNVASRILPVRIHDLDEDDKALLENETGPLRSVDFIFKSPGVNRPLTASDKREDNLNKSHYRDQVNKVANAVKEIISSLKNPVTQSHRTAINEQPPTRRSQNRKPVIVSIFLLLIVIAGYFLYQQRSTNNELPAFLEKSIAVLPFTDLSPEQDQGWFSDGLSDEIINALDKIDEFKVMARTSSFAFKGKNIPIHRIADSLKVNYIIEGSVKKSGNTFRITTRLVRAKDGIRIWSHTHDHEMKEVFSIQEDIAQSIVKTFDIILDKGQLEKMKAHGTTNVEAYLYYLRGREAFNEAHLKTDDRILWIAYDYFKKATVLDPTFSYCYHFMADAFTHFLGYDTEGVSIDTLSRVDAYKLMHQCYDQAIRYATDSTLRNYYRLEKTILSDDWTNLRSTMDIFLKDTDALRVVKFTNITASVNAFVHLSLGQELFELSREALETDPFNILHWEHLMIGALAAGNKNEVGTYYARLNSMLGMSYGEMDFFHLIFGSYDEVVKNNHVPIFTAIALAKANKKKEALTIVNQMTKESFYPFLLIWLYYELEQVQKAEAITQHIDSEPYGFIPLMILTTMTGSESVINIEYAPNYARRLKEANVTLPKAAQ